MQIADTSPGSDHCSIHFHNEEWTAEVVADEVTPEPRFYYVVHHSPPFEIAGWGVSADFDSASVSIGKLAVQS